MAHASVPRLCRERTFVPTRLRHGSGDAGAHPATAADVGLLLSRRVFDRSGAATPWLPRRVGVALLTSAALHVAVLTAFAWVHVDNTAWRVAVDRGHAVSLTVVPAASPTLDQQERRLDLVRPEPARQPPAEAAPQTVLLPRPSAVPSEPLPRRAEDRVEMPDTAPLPVPRRAPASDDRAVATQFDHPPAPPPRATPPLLALADIPHAPVAVPLTPQDAGAASDTPAVKLPSNPAPEYPLAARQRNEQGRVLLLVQLDAEGRVLDAQLRLSSGSPLLDQAALDAVRRWRFSPARSRGVPVTSHLLVPVRFSLRDAG